MSDLGLTNSATAFTGQNAMKDIPTMPNHKLCRVSDDWWVLTEDGVPKANIPNESFELTFTPPTIIDP